jgi:hypothetical protein
MCHSILLTVKTLFCNPRWAAYLPTVVVAFCPYLLGWQLWRHQREPLQVAGMAAGAVVTLVVSVRWGPAFWSALREFGILQRPAMLLAWFFVLVPALQRLRPRMQLVGGASLATVCACVLCALAPAQCTVQCFAPVLAGGMGTAMAIATLCDARMRARFAALAARSQR